MIISTDGRRAKPLALDLETENLRVEFVGGSIGYVPLFDIRGFEITVEGAVLTIRLDKVTSWTARAVGGEDSIGRYTVKKQAIGWLYWLYCLFFWPFCGRCPVCNVWAPLYTERDNTCRRCGKRI